MESNTKIILWGTGALVLGASAFFAYSYFSKAKQEEKLIVDAEQQNQTTTSENVAPATAVQTSTSTNPFAALFASLANAVPKDLFDKKPTSATPSITSSTSSNYNTTSSTFNNPFSDPKWNVPTTIK